MGVSEDNHIRVVNAVSNLAQLMGHQNSNVVASLPAEWTIAQRADDLHAPGDTDHVAVVVSEARDDLACQLSHGRYDQRRNKIAGQQHGLAFHGIEEANGMSQIVHVVVDVCHDSYFHFYDLAE